jgi:hypothetical protein
MNHFLAAAFNSSDTIHPLDLHSGEVPMAKKKTAGKKLISAIVKSLDEAGQMFADAASKAKKRVKKKAKKKAAPKAKAKKAAPAKKKVAKKKAKA